MCPVCKLLLFWCLQAYPYMGVCFYIRQNLVCLWNNECSDNSKRSELCSACKTLHVKGDFVQCNNEVSLYTLDPLIFLDHCVNFNSSSCTVPGTAVTQWLRCSAANWKVSGSIPANASGFFIDMKSLQSHYGPGVDSASNRKEYQEYFLGVKAAGA